MRYQQKRRLLQTIDTMKEGHSFIEEKYKLEEKEVLSEILVYLQEMAVRLGEAVEKEPDYPQTIIGELEKYCERVYECNENLDKDKVIIEMNRIMQGQIKNIETLLRKIEAKVKIAFFPYKYSMWDSLESIWTAAKGDENCECKIIPIPFYLKGKNGELLKKQYEGDSFLPQYPIVDYNEYLIEKEQPDIMYIHNPYDQYNTVTMVEPRFFSDELKRYNGILVYVPYYLSGYCLEYEEMSLISTKGVINSDFIVIQSETLKKAYRYWGIPERKLLVLGNPKVDAIRNLSEDKVTLDKDWKRRIADKKVILFNASISGMLNHKNYLSELRKNMLEIIDRDDFVLIWRPHPLLYNTIKTMVCEQQQQYEELLEMIRTAKNTIIDSESSALPAISVSDAMVSDYSSLVLQYTFTGKPVFIWNKSDLEHPKYIFCDYFKNYFMEEGISLETFLNMVHAGIDDKKDERMEAIMNGMKNADGTCGKKIHAAICQQLMNKV